MRPVRALLACLAAVLAAAPTASAFDEGMLVPPGRFVDLGTHRLYYECSGTGRPLVLLEHGIGGSALGWRELTRVLAGETTVCAYDRAGYGWSDPGPSPRTAARAADELEALLREAELAGPFVLVGHSFGGFVTRIFAARNPTAVAGLVWLDASHPEMGPTPSAGPAAAARRNPIADGAVAAAPRDGAAGAAAFLNTRRKALFAQMDELRHFASSAREVRAVGALPDVPLVAVARDARSEASGGEARWRSHQHALAGLVPRGRLWLAAGSGHDIQRDRPDLVLAAVRYVLEAIRRGDAAYAVPGDADTRETAER